MLFCLLCTDKSGALNVRKAHRSVHLEWLKGLGPRVKLAGPFLTPDGAEPRGSMIVIEAANIAEARRVAAEDPYAKAGLFKHVDVRAWMWTVNAPPAAAAG